MMYQRDMGIPEKRELAEQAEQEFDERAEARIDAEEEQGEQGGHDHDHHCGGDRLAPGWPADLAGFGANLADELGRGDFCHDLGSDLEQLKKGGPRNTRWTSSPTGLA